MGGRLQCKECKSTLDLSQGLNLTQHMLLSVLQLSTKILQKLSENDQFRGLCDQQFENYRRTDFVPAAQDSQPLPVNEETKHVELVSGTLKLPQTLQNDWLSKLKSKWSETTATNYRQWVKRYEDWLGSREVCQDTIESFIDEINGSGRNTKVAAAALKFKYVTVMKLNLTFKGLARASKNKKPHTAVSENVRENLDSIFI